LVDPVVEQVVLLSRELANNGDAEILHKVRVALRRLRAVWWAFAPLMDRDAAKFDTDELKRWAQAAGDTRDWDVLAHLLDSDQVVGTQVGSVIPAIAEQRELALESSRSALSNTDMEIRLRSAMRETLHHLEGDSNTPIADFVEFVSVRQNDV
jgi:CHAD domain-containing protein